MKKIFIGIGSNIEKQKHIRCALQELQLLFGELELSPMYESEAIGFEGESFFNLVAAFESDISVSALNASLKDIEKKYGRGKQTGKYSSKAVDLDILLVGDLLGEVEGVQLPRDEVHSCAFVLLPLAQLAPHKLCPLKKVTYESLWSEFDEGSQKIWPANLN